MSDPIKYDFTCRYLSFLNSVLSRVPVEDDVQFRNFGNPTTVNLLIEFNRELHLSKVSIRSNDADIRLSGAPVCAVPDTALLNQQYFIRSWLKFASRSPTRARAQARPDGL